MIAAIIDSFRDAQEVAITALGGFALFCVLMAFVRTWMRGGS